MLARRAIEEIKKKNLRIVFGLIYVTTMLVGNCPKERRIKDGSHVYIPGRIWLAFDLKYVFRWLKTCIFSKVMHNGLNGILNMFW